MPCKFGKDWIEITDYEFFPASVYPNKKIMATEIDEINLSGAPPEMKVKSELIFISAQFKNQLEQFARDNQIPIIDRFDIWDSILEIYLDTEISEEHTKNTYKILNKYGLTKTMVDEWRERVKNPMVGYNFGTMLWDWVHLGQWDMLSALKLFEKKIGKKEFEKIYWKSMEIALRAYKS